MHAHFINYLCALGANWINYLSFAHGILCIAQNAPKPETNHLKWEAYPGDRGTYFCTQVIDRKRAHIYFGAQSAL